MKATSKKIIRTLLLSATVALFHGSAKADVKKSLSLDLEPGTGNGDLNPEVSKGKKPVVKNVYKILRSGDAKLIAGHRSHSSHSSHSSHRSSGGGHYSHSSSSYGSHYSSSSSSYGSHYSSSSSSYGSSSSSSTYKPAKPKAKTAGDYSLGDRILSLGIHGSDVDALVQYLERNIYLIPGTVSKKGSFHVYDSNVVNAVKHFQKDAGLAQTGKVTSSQLTELRSWSPSKTTIPLGFRSLSAAEGTSGYDVDELVNLLIKAGFSPNPALLKKAGDHYIYSSDIVTAVKVFQAFCSLSPTGILNSATIAKLRATK